MDIFSTYQSAQNQVLKADLPHNRPFPRHWCNKKSDLYFSQKSDSNQNLDFNPVPPHVESVHLGGKRILNRPKDHLGAVRAPFCHPDHPTHTQTPQNS